MKAALQASNGVRVEGVTEDNVVAVLEAMARGGNAVVSSDADPDNVFIQVWLRDNGVYQLEYRAGKPTRHYQTLTVSRDKVAAAFAGWLADDESWKEAFQWKDIGDWFG
ncbi:hypothetical protein ATK30_2122 [Amycolatopsis echigonensis]|uniref:Uncharacterized protein n=1 Tax=Amycolatopsis echigonensis TaxID=2576905 RepID=A0A2N3WBW5_9PSEU|nr:hypothetical protein ATK30_2122 [Amycolatopsis niigatensis]